jgi:5-methylthioribose kinase
MPYLRPMQTLLSADPAIIHSYLAEQNFLLPKEEVNSAGSAGEGNMNVTLRVTTNQRTFILKQSRPFVAKYPDIPAPIGRIAVERSFLQATLQNDELASRSPAVLHYDAANFAMVLEFLDGARDMSYLYNKDAVFTEEMNRQLGAYLSALHQVPVGDFPENNDLLALNHAHVFDLPFRTDNGFPLNDMLSGLGEVARKYQEDDALRSAAKELGEVYLANGPTLVHGDFYPGSFMERDGNVLVIDGEFAHPGRAEFDVAILQAHLRMAGKSTDGFQDHYKAPTGFDWPLAKRFQGVEIMRRIIGIAQLPLELSLEEREELLATAYKLVLG